MDCEDIPNSNVFEEHPEFLSDAQDAMMMGIDLGDITMADLNRCTIAPRLYKNEVADWVIWFLRDVSKERGLEYKRRFIDMVKQVPKGHYNVLTWSGDPEIAYLHHLPILRKANIGKEVSILTVGFIDHSSKSFVNTFVLKEFPEPHLITFYESLLGAKFKCEKTSRDLMICMKCGFSDRIVRRCTGCSFVRYCSKECQRADWKNHKELCNSVRVSKG